MPALVEVVRVDVVSGEDRVASGPMVAIKILVQKRENISRKVDRKVVVVSPVE